ncbi:MAG: hypothetical protein AAGA95_00550 [Pseudomonadota bacterium]
MVPIAIVGAFLVAKLDRVEENVVTDANAKIIQQILAHDAEAILAQIPLKEIEISLPLDGKGPRVLVRVRQGEADKVPERIAVDFQGGSYSVSLEVVESFELYKARSGSDED